MVDALRTAECAYQLITQLRRKYMGAGTEPHGLYAKGLRLLSQFNEAGRTDKSVRASLSACSWGRARRWQAYHTLINSENYHVLKALTFTYRWKVDVIYIDPPYKTGAKYWNFNSDYVKGDAL